MSILNKEEFLARLKAVIGESTDDNDVQFVEDMTDTYNDLETRATDSTDWKKKYDENDASWRKKYRDRFFSAPAKEDPPEEDPDEKPKKLTFESLFKEEK